MQHHSKLCEFKFHMLDPTRIIHCKCVFAVRNGYFEHLVIGQNRPNHGTTDCECVDRIVSLLVNVISK